MKRILITGASGFIGRHATRILSQKGFDVHALTLDKTVCTIDNCAWHVVDLLDIGGIDKMVKKIGAEYLLHLAWDVTPGKYWNSTSNFLWVEASLELLRAFRENGGKRVVMAGTCAEYDWNYSNLNEYATPRNPKTPYGVCKNSLFEMLGSFCSETKLSWAWGRVFYLYGPHEYPGRLIPSAIKALAGNMRFKCSHSNQIRDFLHVEDAAGAFVKIAESDCEGPINIASGNPLKLKDLIGKVAEKLGAGSMVEFGTMPANPGEPEIMTADTKRLVEEVRYEFKFNTDSGIEDAIRFWTGKSGGDNIDA